MPYARTTWKQTEVEAALSNPVHAQSGPHAHSSKHAASGELANHPLFQKARVTALVVDGKSKFSNATFHQKNPDGTWQNNAATRKNNPLPSAEVGTHSVLNAKAVAAALVRALTNSAMLPHLARLDAGQDMKVHVNFVATIGLGNIHKSGMPSQPGVAFNSLFVYAKPNPNNRDVPIFQTVVPASQHKVGGSDPIILI